MNEWRPRIAPNSTRASATTGSPRLFVPINTLVYVGAPAEKNNQLSAMTDLARNLADRRVASCSAKP